MIEEHSPRGLATALRATTASARDRWRYCAVVSTPGHATETQIRQFARGEDRFRARRRGTRSVDPWAGKRCPAALSERAPRMKAVTCTATARSELYGQVSVGQAGYYAYRKPSSPTSRSRKGHRTRGLSTSATSCRRPGKPSPTPTSAPAARWRCWDSDRSVTWRLGLPSTWAIRS